MDPSLPHGPQCTGWGRLQAATADAQLSNRSGIPAQSSQSEYTLNRDKAEGTRGGSNANLGLIKIINVTEPKRGTANVAA